MQSCRVLTSRTLFGRRPKSVGRLLVTVQRRCNASAAAAHSSPLTRKDYLQVLGLTEEATPADIKQAYYTLSLRLHPDTNPGDDTAHTRFMAVLEAYERLNDVARNPMDVISRMEKEREETWKTNTESMDDILRRSRELMQDHARKLQDDPATWPPTLEAAAEYRQLTTQVLNIGIVAAAMLIVIAIIHTMEHR